MATITDQSPNVVFAARAASDDPTRYFMNGIHIEYDDANGRKIVGTDGRRLHVDNYFGDLEPHECCYSVVRSSAKRVDYESIPTEGMFPNWRKVIPDTFLDGELLISLPANKKRYSNKYSTAVCALIRALPADRNIDIRYVDDLLGYAWTVQFSADVAVFASGDKLAVIALMVIPE